LKPSVEIVVADAGPLIALARLDLLALPARLFTRVLLTPTVLHECAARPDNHEIAKILAALAAGALEQVHAPLPDAAWQVDAGEASSIALAIQLDAGVLIDDKLGRELARHLARPVIGTVGLLLLAKRKGLLAELRPLLDALVASGYFLGTDLVAAALRQAGE